MKTSTGWRIGFVALSLTLAACLCTSALPGNLQPFASSGAPAPAPGQEVSIRASTDERVSLKLPGGPQVEVPAGGLYRDDTLIVKQVAAPADVNAGTYVLVGDVYSIELENEEVFADVVTVKLPYDARRLPAGVPEANLFAVTVRDGQWVRVRSDVDQANKIIKVDTLHNGLWSWAYNEAANFDSDARDFMGSVRELPGALQESARIVMQRMTQWEQRWAECDVRTEEYDADLLGSGQYVNALADLVVTDLAVMGAAGKGAVFSVAGTPVGYIGPGAVGGLFVGDQAGDSSPDARCFFLSVESYARLNEARAVMKALEIPEQTDFIAGDVQFVTRWVEIQREAAPEGTPSVDWDLSDIPDSGASAGIPPSGQWTAIGGQASFDCATTPPLAGGETEQVSIVVSEDGQTIDTAFADGQCPLTLQATSMSSTGIAYEGSHQCFEVTMNYSVNYASESPDQMQGNLQIDIGQGCTIVRDLTFQYEGE